MRYNWGEVRVLITGISGFVGSLMAKKLVDLGAEVYGIIRRRNEGVVPKRLIDLRIDKCVNLIEGDITDITSIFFAIDQSQPDVIFHLAAQSFVPRSFKDPLETIRTNVNGTLNLLEAIRLKDLDPIIVSACSSEEYGLQIISDKHYQRMIEKYGVIHPQPVRIPELPINEENFLRPMSPYAVSKVAVSYLMQNYYYSYGLRTIISRAFNHEGAGRGHNFVTSTIVRQAVMLRYGETDAIHIGNVNAFRDWSHVEDIIDGYLLLADKGKPGNVYVQGSMRTNSVLTYILLSLEQLGYTIHEIETFKGDKKIKNPTERNMDEFFGVKFEKTKVDELMLKEEVSYKLEDQGITVKTDKGDLKVKFNGDRFRPLDVPILMSDTGKIKKLGFKVNRKLDDIIKAQINYYLNPNNRKGIPP